LRVALLNSAEYEYRAHVPFALADGVSQEQIDALPGWQVSKSFDDRERAVLAYTDSMTRGIRVPDPIFAEVRRHFDDREVVELTATIAGYNLVSRFLVAMQLD
jgi:alkylhydroperoxidase family enzyme